MKNLHNTIYSFAENNEKVSTKIQPQVHVHTKR